MTLSSMGVGKKNRVRILRYLLHEGRVSMQQIADALLLSKPTVLGVLKDFAEEGLVREDGDFHSIGGRKAKAFCAVTTARLSAGIDITANHLVFVLTDLAGSLLSQKRLRIPFRKEEGYAEQVFALLEEFLDEAGAERDKLLGVGLSVPAIVDMEQNLVLISNALKIGNVSLMERKGMQYPGQLVNDANASAVAENIGRREIGGMIYLSLSNTVGGSILLEKNVQDGPEYYPNPYDYIHFGRHWHSAEVGHILIHPGGKRCYCGKSGCADAYLSALNLANLYDGVLEDFFTALDEREEKALAAWEAYEKDLLLLIDAALLLADVPVVLGGYVGNLIGQERLASLREKAQAGNIFGEEKNFLRLCSFHREAAALGAAYWFCEQFIGEL